MTCDNYSTTHNTVIVNEDNSAVWVMCTECAAQGRVGKDIKGNPEHRAYGEWFKRDVLQPPAPLYYKYAGGKGMNVV